MSQSEAILAHLQSGESLTPIQALLLFGSNRLAARVYELRQLGHNIQKTTARTRSGKNVAKYTLTK